MQTIAETLVERGARYGTFMENAKISEAVLDVIRSQPGWQNFQPDQKVAVEIIVQKLARALTGNAQYDDNWRDIAGYAQLIVDRINGTGAYARTDEQPADDNSIVTREQSFSVIEGGFLVCRRCGQDLGDAHKPECTYLEDARNTR